MTTAAGPVRDQLRAGPVGFVLWALVGAGMALGISVIGLFTAPVALVLALVLLWLGQGTDAAGFGLLAGPAAVAGLIAYLNRSGPGAVCSHSGGGLTCEDESNPWPWLVAAIALLLLSVLLYARARRQRR